MNGTTGIYVDNEVVARILSKRRRNGEGKVGTFETPFTIPDLSATNTLRFSSVILSNQREPLKQQIAAVKNDKKLLAENPLIDNDGQKIVPNVTRVFRSGQNLFVYLEVYDPMTAENPPQNLRAKHLTARRPPADAHGADPEKKALFFIEPSATL